MEITKNSVKDFGAVGTGKVDDAPAFQAAFDSGLPVITVPVGKYMIGSPLKIGSNIKLLVHPRALIKLGDYVCTKRGDFLLTNKHHKEGDCNISIYGGIWNGNNKTNAKAPEMFNDNGCSGVMLNFFNVKNLTLSGMTLSDPGAYYTRFCHLDGFLFENITFCSLNPISNNDGIHFNGFCENGIIRNLVAHTPGSPSDDMVAFNADDIVTRVEGLDAECGYIRNIVVDGLYADSCQSFMRFLSINSDITNISVSNVRGGFSGMAINMDAARYCCTPIVDPESPEYREGVGCVKNVTVSHLAVHSTSTWSEARYMRLESNMENFRIYDFQRMDDLESYRDAKTLDIQNISPTEILIEGVSQDNLDAFCEGTESEKKEYVNELGHNTFSAKIKTKLYDSLTLPRGGFSSLTINKI